VTWAQYAAAWSALHGGFDPDRASPLVRGWVRLAYRGGSVLARRGVGPMAVTAIGLLLCAAVPAVVPLGRAGLPLGALLVLLASAADGLDGAVAVLTGSATRLGFVVDSAADRLGELAWLAAFWLAGAPGWLVVAAGAVSWLHEYVRARASAAGMREIGAVTVAERPTRVIVAVAGLLVAGVVAGVAGPVLTAAAAVWLALGAAGLVQLAVAVRRELDRP
jgi:phosphatidylglycerophosphate synthase